MRDKREDAIWLKPLLAFWSTTIIVPFGCFIIYLVCDPPNISLKHIIWWWPHVGLWHAFAGGVLGVCSAWLTYIKEKAPPDSDDPD